MPTVNWDHMIEDPRWLSSPDESEPEIDDISVTGVPDPADTYIPASSAEWTNLHGRDFAEPDGWADDWRDLTPY